AQSRSRIAISGPSSSEFAEEIQDPELPDSPDGLPDDPLGHLGLADVPVGEDDRDLDEAGPSLPGAHAHLDLEGVALGFDPIEVDPLERLATEALVAARRVPDREPRDPAGVDVREVREEETPDRPVDDGDPPLQ